MFHIKMDRICDKSQLKLYIRCTDTQASIVDDNDIARKAGEAEKTKRKVEFGYWIVDGVAPMSLLCM